MLYYYGIEIKIDGEDRSREPIIFEQSRRTF